MRYFCRFYAYLCTLYFFIMNEMQTAVVQGTMLPLMEEFYTIQGEGFHTGTAAYFIRVGGCDVGCHWCDVKESWNAELHPPTSISTIVQNAKAHCDTIVITGGEPLTWDMLPLTSALRSEGMRTHMETSGAYELSGEWDWICLSPKKNRLPTKSVCDNADELKMIIYNRHDFIFAEEQAAKVNANCKLFLQPEWSKRDEMTPLIVDYVMKHPKWRVSLQTHKYLDIP
ncbi:MAG: 7-carboxy-7-deazaguanine synthase QueE [Flavobacterium sp.]|nr:MAG: 7-carboxy-7-deazaguanine synthase QueE [Flavobacterium sp.]